MDENSSTPATDPPAGSWGEITSLITILCIWCNLQTPPVIQASDDDLENDVNMSEENVNVDDCKDSSQKENTGSVVQDKDHETYLNNIQMAKLNRYVEPDLRPREPGVEQKFVPVTDDFELEPDVKQKIVPFTGESETVTDESEPVTGKSEQYGRRKKRKASRSRETPHKILCQDNSTSLVHISLDLMNIPAFRNTEIAMLHHAAVEEERKLEHSSDNLLQINENFVLLNNVRDICLDSFNDHCDLDKNGSCTDCWALKLLIERMGKLLRRFGFILDDP